jgi:hypothetical protein
MSAMSYYERVSFAADYCRPSHRQCNVKGCKETAFEYRLRASRYPGGAIYDAPAWLCDQHYKTLHACTIESDGTIVPVSR